MKISSHVWVYCTKNTEMLHHVGQAWACSWLSSRKHYMHVCWLKEIRKVASRGQVHYLMSNVHHFVSKQLSAIRPWSSKTKKQMVMPLAMQVHPSYNMCLWASTQGFSNLSVDMILVAHLPSSYCFSDSFQTVKVSNSFHGWNILWPDLSM